MVAALLTESQLDGLLDTALLLTSEVVSNAVLHARTEIALVVVVEPPVVRVEVADDEERPPELRLSTEEDTSGRGMMLVELLSAAWGVRPFDGGKCVWFEVAA